MLFNSYEFMIFLPVVFILYWIVFKNKTWQNLLVVFSSYVFYGWWDWRFLLLIAFTSFCSFGSGLLLAHYKGCRYRQRVVCVGNIVLNLGILGVFKYFNFFVENLEVLIRTLFGYQLDWVTMHIILPVGISFYTFQALSYTIDVYRGDIQYCRNIIDFFAFISFFPQLVAGPIERATNLLSQFQHGRLFNYAKAVDGMRQMLWGFFKKMVVADNCAADLNPLWDSYSELSGINLLGLGILFTFQIYCDFSGYSDIAIGCSRLFGFDLKQNFNLPFLSRSIPEFWRRWHISLTSWFRDYIYIPLGGNRCGRLKMLRNTLVVFFLSGLWHGANWTYICWGLYHGCLIALYALLRVNTKKKGVVAQHRLLPNLSEISQMMLTFLFVVIGFILFRSKDIYQGWGFISRMILTIFDDFHPRLGSLYTIVAILILIICEYLQRSKIHVLQFSDSKLFRYRITRWGVYVAIFTMIFLFTFTGSSQEFIYFQF